jgi:hypothetical protein
MLLAHAPFLLVAPPAFPCEARQGDASPDGGFRPVFIRIISSLVILRDSILRGNDSLKRQTTEDYMAICLPATCTVPHATQTLKTAISRPISYDHPDLPQSPVPYRRSTSAAITRTYRNLPFLIADLRVPQSPGPTAAAVLIPHQGER